MERQPDMLKRSRLLSHHAAEVGESCALSPPYLLAVMMMTLLIASLEKKKGEKVS